MEPLFCKFIVEALQWRWCLKKQTPQGFERPEELSHTLESSFSEITREE